MIGDPIFDNFTPIRHSVQMLIPQEGTASAVGLEKVSRKLRMHVGELSLQHCHCAPLVVEFITVDGTKDGLKVQECDLY